MMHESLKNEQSATQVSRACLVNLMQVVDFNGGPVQTRTADLYRVKVVRSITYRPSILKTKDLRVEGLDRKWTSVEVWTSTGPCLDH